MGVKGQIAVDDAYSDFYFKDKRYDWTSGDLDYYGLAVVMGSATDTGDKWWVWKLTWSSGDLTRLQGPVNCNWDDRATEF